MACLEKLNHLKASNFYSNSAESQPATAMPLIMKKIYRNANQKNNYVRSQESDNQVTYVFDWWMQVPEVKVGQILENLKSMLLISTPVVQFKCQFLQRKNAEV
jgi:hypothetical protein